MKIILSFLLGISVGWLWNDYTKYSNINTLASEYKALFIFTAKKLKDIKETVNDNK